MTFRWRRAAPVIAVIVVLAVVAGVPAVRGSLLRACGRLLVVDEPVEPADAIVVPEWAGEAGVLEASELFHRGIADRVALLPEPPEPAEQELSRRGISHVDESENLVHLLRALGVANVEVIAHPAGGTDEESQVLRSWSDRRRFRSILVVSSPDHSRRVRRALRRSMAGHPTKVIIRSARHAAFDPGTWWTTRHGIRTGIVELQKLSLDFMRHPLS